MAGTGRISPLRYLRLDACALFAKKRFVRLLAVAAGLWLVHTFLLGDGSLVDYFFVRSKNASLRAEIIQTEAALDSLHGVAEGLEESRAKVEEVARERYHLAAEGEKVYVFIPIPASDRERILLEVEAADRAGEEETVSGGAIGRQ